MVFERLNSEEGATRIGEALLDHLKRGSVLWLVPGGSAMKIALGAVTYLCEQNISLENLTITLTDERYGEVGHADSNWRQLEGAGFCAPGATLRPVLDGGSIEETARAWGAWLEEALAKANYRIGLFGIGPDGHTSGILPHSPAVTAPGLVAAYDGGAYQRITTTGEALARLDEAVVYAAGESKHPVLDQLETEVPVEDQPAQLLKRVLKVTIFNDYKDS